MNNESPPGKWYEIIDRVAPGKFRDLAMILVIHGVGHPDDMATARAIMSRYPDDVNLDPPLHFESGREYLEEYENYTRRALQLLESRGWKWKKDRSGEGHFEFQTGTRGRKPHWTAIYIWMLLFQKEKEMRCVEEARQQAEGITTPVKYVHYCVRNDKELRAYIEEELGCVLIKSKRPMDTLIKGAINSWLKKGGAPPPWAPLVE